MVPAKVVLSTLLGLTQKFTSDEPLEDILQAVTDAAVRLLPGDHASIRVLNDARTELLCGARSGEGATHHPMVFRPGEGVIGWVAEHGWVAYIQDSEADHRFKVGSSQGFTVRSLVAVPLLSAGKVVGVLSTSAPEPNAFTAEDEALVLLLANTTVPIIDRARLERLALVDDLTQAYNDRYLLPRLRDEVEQAGKRATPFSILMLDLDHLKQLNHTHGFEIGDRMLQRVAEHIRQRSDNRHKLVRRGGGTFVLLMPQTPPEAVQTFADALRASLAEQPLDLGGDVTVTQTLSIGLAHWEPEERAMTLLQRADTAMKLAKQGGRDRVEVAEPAGQDAPAPPASGE